MKPEKFFQSKIFTGIVLAAGIIISLAIVFRIGVFVGQERANFSFEWAKEYHRNFGGPSGGFLGQIPGRDFTNGNGLFGQIIKIDFSSDGNQATITIKGSDNIEKIVLAGQDTTIRTQRQNVKLSDLKIDDTVVIIGNPNNSGQIQAELIRIMP